MKNQDIKNAAIIKIQSLIDTRQRQLENTSRDLCGFVPEDAIIKSIESRTRQIKVLNYILESINKN